MRKTELFKNSSMDKSKILIFLHLPRSGGITLKQIINRQYENKEIIALKNSRESIANLDQLTKGEKQKIKCIIGHFPFGSHKYFYGESTYITMLRDPVDRIISHYYSAISREYHYLHNEVVQKNMTLSEYVTSGISFEMENGCTQLLSGEEKKIPIDINTPEAQQCIKTAKENLIKYFTAIGIVERYDESLLLFKRKLGWKNIFYYNPTRKT